MFLKSELLEDGRRQKHKIRRRNRGLGSGVADRIGDDKPKTVLLPEVIPGCRERCDLILQCDGCAASCPRQYQTKASE